MKIKANNFCCCYCAGVIFESGYKIAFDFFMYLIFIRSTKRKKEAYT